MFFRMVKGTLIRQWKKMILIAFTIGLGASLATAMLSVVLDVGDKVNKELKTFGANITVMPKRQSVVSDLYDVSGGKSSGAYLKENELGKIKTIFWAFNIVDYTPFVKSNAKLSDGSDVQVVGSWFNHHMNLPTGEQLDAGIASLRSWWEIKDGKWIDEQANSNENDCMIGSKLAEKLGVKAGDKVKVKGSKEERELNIVGVFSSGGDEDERIFTGLKAAQALSGLEGKIDSIEVSALTTPDNELAVKAAKDPQSLTVAQYEIWYCTAYVSSICYQIQEVITDSVAAPVRQVADSEGAILDKTQLLMLLITILSLIGSALGICNLVTASVMERSSEIGLMKAIGAHNSAITGLVLTEIIITAIIGGTVGFGCGIGFAQIIGESVFGSLITLRPMVIPIVGVLVVIVTLIGSIPAIRMLLKLEPEAVLHGR
ncbi:efflux ABC transporter, permease protein [Catonella morbi ATCC 51271]|uniref:Efflux ABC transporter, permease protein n=1 Tax=Catonella morbi ATCC 51271 TaxID=592026 RepID=V2Z7X0_9FIRM|nr:ABC transporter permease [Catonella morbi]ESL03030.1 efflux ABC transporter, permease protein [Catonella morbi ATCC 51271]